MMVLKEVIYLLLYQNYGYIRILKMNQLSISVDKLSNLSIKMYLIIIIVYGGKRI